MTNNNSATDRRRVFLISCFGAMVLSGASPNPSFAEHTIESLRNTYVEKQQEVWAMMLTVHHKQKALVEHNLLRQFANQAYLRDDRHVFAFKHGKRLHKILQPSEVEPIGDPWIMAEPPPGSSRAVMKNYEQVKAELEIARQQVEAYPHAVSWDKEKLQLSPLEVWAMSGETELRHLDDDGGMRLSVGEDRVYTHPFQSNYLKAICMSVPDPVTVAAGEEELPLGDNLATMLGPEGRGEVTLSTEQGAPVVVRRFKVDGEEYVERLMLATEKGLMPVSRSFGKVGASCPIYDWRYEDPMQISKGTWIPKRVVFTEYAPSHVPQEYAGQAFLETSMEVETIATNDEVPDDAFELEFGPGTNVMDFVEGRTLGFRRRALSYTMPADGGDLDKVIARARMDLDQEYAPMKKRVLLIVANLAGICLLCGILVVRRKRRS